MDKVMTTILFILGLAVVFYLLYVNGFLIVNAKKAVMYAGSMRGRKASFSSCSGYTNRVVRFKAGGAVRFDFHVELARGEVCVELLDSSKRMVMRLTGANPSASILVERKERYYLVFRFQSATGSYDLMWE